MLDIRWIEENPEAFDAALVKRGEQPCSNELVSINKRRKENLVQLQTHQEQRNAASREIGSAKARGDETAAKLAIDKVAEIKTLIQRGEDIERQLDAQLDNVLSTLPNIPLEDVPVGASDADNVLYRMFGEKPQFDFEPKQHFDLGEALGLMDFERAARLAGSRFVVLQGPLARLERALAQFMLDLHTNENGYQEVSPPLLVRDNVMFGSGQLPKFNEDSFKTTDDRWLIPTSEVPLANLVREMVLDGHTLPLRMAAYTPCFRSEAGSAGRDTRGMLRVHQFAKVELISITKAETSEAELERMLSCAEEVLKRLSLHYRVMTLCSGDMGFSSRKTYDIEVWLPGQGNYREISSCSVCGDFQSRRMNARYRVDDEKRLQFCHTLNGSGLAVGRTLIAVLENYQNQDGSITVPDVLQSYMGGLNRIGPPDV